jgi:hypothetical protein
MQSIPQGLALLLNYNPPKSLTLKQLNQSSKFRI